MTRFTRTTQRWPAGAQGLAQGLQRQCWVQMAELQRQLGLDMGAALEEYQETQQVLFPVALVSAGWGGMLRERPW